MALASEKFDKLLHTVMHLEVRKGHLRWTVSELSRLTKVTRPLIYYYLGKTKIEIFKATLYILAKDFYGLSDERIAMKAKTGRLDSILATRKVAMGNADILAFFYANRFGKTWMQPELVDMEKAFIARLDKELEGISEEFQILFKALCQSFVTAAFFNEEQIRIGFAKLCELIEKEGYSTEKLRKPQ